jgi:hypothetical protein
MTNWTKIAEGRALRIPAEELERVAPALDALEAAFRPLVATIPHELEPAIVFRAAEDAA